MKSLSLSDCEAFVANPIRAQLHITHMSTYCYNVCVFLIGNGVIRIRPPLATATPLSPTPLPPPIKFSSIVSAATASHSSLGLGTCSDGVCLAPFVIILLPVNSKQHVQPQRHSIVDDSWPLVVVVAVARHKDLRHN